MPPQTQSDQAYPERARRDDTRVDEAQTQPLREPGPAPAAPRPPVSRRSILRGAAGVGVVGIAAAGGADTSTGLFDVFGGDGQTRVRNPALVRQLLANLKLA